MKEDRKDNAAKENKNRERTFASFREKKRLNLALILISAWVVPALFLLIGEYVERVEFAKIIPALWRRPVLLGYFVFVLFYGLIVLLSRRAWVAALALGLFNVALRFANYYKLIYLATPVMPSDISLIGDAATVAGEYEVALYKEFWIGLMVTLLIVLLLVPLRLPRFEQKKKQFWVRLGSIAIVLALIVCYFGGVLYNRNAWETFKYYEMSFALRTEYYVNTFHSSLFVKTGQWFSQKPPGYDKQSVAEIAGELTEVDSAVDHAPDIIVVLAETFNFLDPYEEAGIVFSGSIRENYDRIAEEAITGDMVSSQYGGGTAEIEYEVLTGFSTDSDILPLNAFNSYTYDEMPCISNYLKTQNYTNYAIHSYHYAYYNRIAAYGDMGFDHRIDQSMFKDAERVGEYISDSAAVDKTIEVYEQAVAAGEQVLLHLVTMQNHGPHTIDSLGPDGRAIQVVEAPAFSENDVRLLEEMATKMYLTDQAIGKLIDYFRDVDRDVIIVVYGDHQTGLVINYSDAELLRKTDFYEANSASEASIKTHLTPYLIWSNYQAPSTGSFGYLAPSQLLPYALREFDAARPAYFDWLAQQSENSSVSARSGNFIIHADDSVTPWPSEQDLDALGRRYTFEYEVIFKKNKAFGDLIY